MYYSPCVVAGLLPFEIRHRAARTDVWPAVSLEPLMLLPLSSRSEIPSVPAFSTDLFPTEDQTEDLVHETSSRSPGWVMVNEAPYSQLQHVRGQWKLNDDVLLAVMKTARHTYMVGEILWCWGWFFPGQGLSMTLWMSWLLWFPQMGETWLHNLCVGGLFTPCSTSKWTPKQTNKNKTARQSRDLGRKIDSSRPTWAT